MRPSISMSLEPGLERGVPWGRDLYTFVTSAAGHMMRTLQKPRKSRPSKRQVNHRRFLHNMIQRKFADIEAANHRLASALYFKDGDKNTSSLLSRKTETPDPSATQSVPLQDPDEYSTQTDAHGFSKPRSDASVGLHETEVGDKKQVDMERLWKSRPKSQSSSSTARMNAQSKRRQKKERRGHKLAELSFMSSPEDLEYFHKAELFDSEYYHNESQLKPIIDLSEETQAHLNDSNVVRSAQNDGSLSFSPEFSPLSVDSCDLGVQMFPDLPSCTQTQKNISESQLSDITDLFTVESKYSEGCMDVEAYLESICARQSNAGLEVCADYDVTFADLSDNFTGLKDLLSEDDESTYGYGCHGDQAANTKYSQTSKQSKDTAEIQFNHLKPPQSADITQNQLLTPISHHHNPTQLQTHQLSQEGSLSKLVNYENSLNFASFEGVAQSFSAPPQDAMHRAVATPPREGDWLFTDILMDRKSPDYLENIGLFFD